MTDAGWMFLLASWAIVTGMCGICFKWTLAADDTSKKEVPFTN